MNKKFIIFLPIMLAVIAMAVFVRMKEKSIDNLLAKNGCPKCRQVDNAAFYSKYFEDYILSIIFADQPKGHYVDVGASDPNIDNVTKYFYLHGWRGINIEPNKEAYNLLVKERPEDKNYNIAISNENGELAINKKDNGLLANVISNVEKYAQEVKQYVAPTHVLSDILLENHLTQIDFLKVDVKGFEKNILLGLDLNIYRPKVILLDALDSKTMLSNHKNWEDYLINADYKFVLFDGLNRFYIDNKHQELIPRFEQAYKCISVVNDQKHILLSKPSMSQ